MGKVVYERVGCERCARPFDRDVRTRVRFCSFECKRRSLIEEVGDGDCWLWNGQVNAGGYGVIYRREGGRVVERMAHRHAWVAAHGPIPPGMFVLHRCDVRRCCNPDWLCECDDEPYEDCWNCGGEGYVANCQDEIACLYPEDGCDLCMEPCEFCNPPASAIEARQGQDAQRLDAKHESVVGEAETPTPHNQSKGRE